MNKFSLFIIIISVIVAFNVYMSWFKNNSVTITFNNTLLTTTITSYPPTNIIYGCNADSDCQWISVNCCTENSGAQWQCANKQSYIDCTSKQVLCPQVISGKPAQACTCVSGRCSG